MTLHSRIAGAAALLAAASMAVPASAVDLPGSRIGPSVPAAAAWDSDSVNADGHRYRKYRRDRGIDAGDVIAGAVILGTVAAIASAASRNRDRDRPYQYRPYRGGSPSLDSRGIDRAVDMCVREIERDVRVRSVDSVNRLAEGWQVEGSVYDGEGFTCRVGNDGRIDGLDYGLRGWNGASAPGAAEDRQWNAETYEQARRARDTGAQPAYPGGPSGEDYDDEAGAVDGRYSTSQAPDFGA